MQICVVRRRGMPRKDFIASFPGRTRPTCDWVDKHIRAKRKHSSTARPSTRPDIERCQRKLIAVEARQRSHASRDQGNQPPDVHRRGQGASRQEGDGRGQPAPGDLDRQEVHQPRPAVPGPDPGGQHRPDEGGGQVRIPPRLQVLDLRDLVDPPGHHALDRRPGAHHPHPGAHDRDDQQAQPHLAPDAAGDGPRADAGRAGRAHGDARGQGAQGAQDRQGADLHGDADRRRRRFAPRRLHRGRDRWPRPIDAATVEGLQGNHPRQCWPA